MTIKELSIVKSPKGNSVLLVVTEKGTYFGATALNVVRQGNFSEEEKRVAEFLKATCDTEYIESIKK